MPLARPPEDWPLILCGPMLRRVTHDQVCVFVALSRPARLRLRLFTGPSPSDEADTEVAGQSSDEHDTLALGARLHAVVVVFRPQTPLVSQQNYFYDLAITHGSGSDQTTADLGSLDLLTGSYPLGYAPGAKPGFALAPGLASLRLLHGSCRKPHGDGRDLLALADDLLFSNQPAGLRPHQLVLTGDQIYADDVALPLAQLIADTAPLLLSSSPTPPAPGSASDPDSYRGELPDGPWATPEPIGHAMNADARAPGERRRRFTLPMYAGFGVDNGGAGHLMYLGEFYAMYLLSWSNALWPIPAPGDPFLPVDEQRLATDAHDQHVHKCTADEQRPALERFFATLPKVRRVLANIPTWMMFDDHEVSDDWNLNRHWRKRVLGMAAGHQTVRNAMLAYAVFQDWGNRPQDYASGTPGAEILNMLRCPSNPVDPLASPTGLPPILTHGGDTERGRADQLLGLTETPAPSEQFGWHYAVAFDEHQLIALDTRTRRGFPGSDRAPAQIIAPDQLVIQLDVPRLAHPDLLAIVVAPGPVIDLPLSEQLKAMLDRVPDPVTQAKFQTLPDEFADRETWVGDRAALAAMIDALSDFGRVVLLSGDVHYGFSNHSRVERGQAPAIERSRIVQLCASALLNEGKPTLALAGIEPAIPALSGFIDETGTVYQALQHDLHDIAEVTAASTDVATDTLQRLWQTVLWYDQEQVRERHLRFPIELWQGSPGLSEVAARFNELITSGSAPPGARVLTRFVHAEADGDLGPAGITRAPAPDTAPTDPWGVLVDQLQQVDGLIAIDNLGLVEFASTGTGTGTGGAAPDQVVHTLFWMARGTRGPSDQPWFTRHRLPLDPNASD